MPGNLPRWDRRSGEEWIEQAARFEKMVGWVQHNPQLEASFSALARDAIVRAKDGQRAAARVLAGADLHQTQFGYAATRSAPADVEFFRRREAQERLAASQSSNVRVRRVHLEMAIRYGALVSSTEENCRRKLRIVS